MTRRYRIVEIEPGKADMAHERFDQYETDMEGADWEDFIKAE